MTPPRRGTIALMVALLPVLARAQIVPRVDTEPGASGFAYVGTMNPSGQAGQHLPANDFADITITRDDAMDESEKRVDLHGGRVQALHFGTGFAQSFVSIAQITASVDANIGEIRSLVAATGTVLPLQYDLFPGVTGRNPFYAWASVGITGSFVDSVVIPATAAAPNAGDLDTVNLLVQVDCRFVNKTGNAGPGASGHASATLFKGTGPSFGNVLGDVLADDPPAFSPGSFGCAMGAGNASVKAPVLTPLGVRMEMRLGVVSQAGNGLAYGNGSVGDFVGGTVVVDSLATGVILLDNSDGKGAIGSLGRDYGIAAYEAAHASSTTTSTTTTTTTTYTPPTTLPSCAGYCGDGLLQPDCAEACECPRGPAMEVITLCDAATSIPALGQACARCAGCQIDTSPCVVATTTTTTLDGSSTTTTTTSGSSTTTLLPPASETCGNCADDDGDGRTDFEDARCCSGAALGTSLGTLALKTGKSGTEFTLVGTIGSGAALPDLRGGALEVQIAETHGHALLCERVPAEQLVRKKHGVLVFHGTPNAAIRTIVARPGHDGLRLEVRGQIGAPSAGATDPVRITLALATEPARCGSVSATLRRSRKGKGKALRFP